MRLEGYMLITRDIDVSRDFYCRVMQAEVLMDMGNHVVFSEGFSLLLESDWSRFAGVATADLAYRHLSGQLVFEVDDIRAFLRRLGAFPEVRMLHEVRPVADILADLWNGGRQRIAALSTEC